MPCRQTGLLACDNRLLSTTNHRAGRLAVAMQDQEDQRIRQAMPGAPVGESNCAGCHGYRTLLSREGRAYRESVCALLAGRVGQPLFGPLEVQLDLYPPIAAVAIGTTTTLPISCFRRGSIPLLWIVWLFWNCHFQPAILHHRRDVLFKYILAIAP